MGLTTLTDFGIVYCNGNIHDALWNARLIKLSTISKNIRFKSPLYDIKKAYRRLCLLPCIIGARALMVTIV